MFNVLIDTSVWLDFVADQNQTRLLSVVEDLIKDGLMNLIVPGTLITEYRKNRNQKNTLRATNTMKHTLRCHDFGLMTCSYAKGIELMPSLRSCIGHNRASPQGVAARIDASFVARLANTASIGFTSLRAIDDSDSQRTHVSLC
jgi:hypothetical protein